MYTNMTTGALLHLLSNWPCHGPQITALSSSQFI